MSKVLTDAGFHYKSLRVLTEKMHDMQEDPIAYVNAEGGEIWTVKLLLPTLLKSERPLTEADILVNDFLAITADLKDIYLKREKEGKELHGISYAIAMHFKQCVNYTKSFIKAIDENTELKAKLEGIIKIANHNLNNEIYDRDIRVYFGVDPISKDCYYDIHRDFFTEEQIDMLWRQHEAIVKVQKKGAPYGYIQRMQAILANTKKIFRNPQNIDSKTWNEFLGTPLPIYAIDPRKINNYLTTANLTEFLQADNQQLMLLHRISGYTEQEQYNSLKVSQDLLNKELASSNINLDNLPTTYAKELLHCFYNVELCIFNDYYQDEATYKVRLAEELNKFAVQTKYIANSLYFDEKTPNEHHKNARSAELHACARIAFHQLLETNELSREQAYEKVMSDLQAGVFNDRNLLEEKVSEEIAEFLRNETNLDEYRDIPNGLYTPAELTTVRELIRNRLSGINDDNYTSSLLEIRYKGEKRLFNEFGLDAFVGEHTPEKENLEKSIRAFQVSEGKDQNIAQILTDAGIKPFDVLDWTINETEYYVDGYPHTLTDQETKDRMMLDYAAYRTASTTEEAEKRALKLQQYGINIDTLTAKIYLATEPKLDEELEQAKASVIEAATENSTVLAQARENYKRIYNDKTKETEEIPEKIEPEVSLVHEKITVQLGEPQTTVVSEEEVVPEIVNNEKPNDLVEEIANKLNNNPVAVDKIKKLYEKISKHQKETDSQMREIQEKSAAIAEAITVATSIDVEESTTSTGGKGKR